MTRQSHGSRITKRLFGVVVAVTATACGVAPDDAPDTVGEVAAASTVFPYGDGPVLANVKIVPVFWGTSVNPDVVSFYAALAGNEYLQRLAEYSTPTQTIGLGSTTAAYPIVPSIGNLGLNDANIAAELASQIQASHLPSPDANTLYTLHFPPGTVINGCTVGGCCADHRSDSETIFNAQVVLHYTRMVDFATGECCAPDCGINTPFESLTAAASHEVVEAVTDPQPFSGWASPLALDPEIADACRDTFGTITAPNGATYTVQSYFSNAAGSCTLRCAKATCTAAGSCTPGSGCTVHGQHPSFNDAASVFDTDAANHGWIGPCAISGGHATFCPGSSITRGELATVIIRALYGDSFPYTSIPYFTDLPATDWRFPYVQKLRDLGITHGTSASTYGPDTHATRGDAAVFVTRAYALLNFGGTENFTACANPFFTDEPPSDVLYYKYVQELRTLGITRGTSATTYSPGIDASRENIAVFVEAAFDPLHFGDRSPPAGCP
jgi:hypothetical protein